MKEDKVIIALAAKGKTVRDFCAATGRERKYILTRIKAMGLVWGGNGGPKRWQTPKELKKMEKEKDRGMVSVAEGLRLGYQMAGIYDPVYNPKGAKR